MGQIDLAAKDMLNDNHYFADTVNFFLHNGEKVIKPEQLNDMNINQFVLFDEDDSDNRKRNEVDRYRDLMKTVKTDNNGEIICITGLENQASVNRAMPVRDMLYDSLSYTHQIKDMADKKKPLFSGMPSDKYLKPVITIVINFDSKPWDEPLSLHELIDPEHREYLAYVPDYRINLIDPYRMTEDDFDKFETDLGNVLRLIKRSNNRKELARYVEANGSKYINLDHIAKTFISVMTGIEIPENKEGGYNMLQAFAEIHEELEIAGRKVEFAESQLKALKKKSEDLELENENVKLENESIKLENESVKQEINSVKLENESVKHDINTLIESLRERGFTDEEIQSMLKK